MLCISRKITCGYTVLLNWKMGVSVVGESPCILYANYIMSMAPRKINVIFLMTFNQFHCTLHAYRLISENIPSSKYSLTLPIYIYN